MRFINVIKFFLIAALLVSCGKTKKNSLASNNTLAVNTPSRPNILIILCDDLGYSDVGFNGSKEIPTPALDNLADNGTIFTSAYVAHPFCGPSRTSLMTGVYPHTIGAQFNLPPNREQQIEEGITLKETFISKVLDDAGYYTGILGKWHLGSTPDYHPNKRGFDEFYGFLGGGHDYFPENFSEKYELQKKNGVEIIWDYLEPLQHNGVEVKETEYITDALSREAVSFIDKASKKEEPFFLYLSYNAPHTPLQAKEEDLKLFEHIKDKKRRTYAAMVYAVDKGVEKVVKSLQATGQFENTLIVFFSDNGGKKTAGANNFPLKEGKGSVYEGGYRTPMFFHWPNVVPAGKTFDHPVSALDFYPTFAGLAGAKIPASKQLDGKDIWNDFLLGKASHTDDNIYVMRHRSGYSDVAVRRNQWKAIRIYQQNWKLFNVVSDMGETIDLSTKHPDILKELISETEKWSKTHTTPRWFTPMKLGDVWNEKGMAEFPNTFILE